MNWIITILLVLLIFIIASLPLYLAVKLLGGKTSILKTILVLILTGLVIALVHTFINAFASIIAFILVIWLYREMFRLKWWKAIVAWFLQFVVFWLILLIFGLLGISLFFFS